MIKLMRDKVLARKFGATIRRLRRDAGVSQEEFAERCGIHRTYIGLIERGERVVTIETVDKLARTFGISMSDLFAQVETQTDQSFPTSSMSSEE